MRPSPGRGAEVRWLAWSSQTGPRPIGTEGAAVATRPLRLFNTLGRAVGGFAARKPHRVGMYSCGPTVYAHQHIGNMRPYVFADTLKRVLRWKGFDVHHVVNITDVGHLTSDADDGEDKLELAAKREHKDAWEIAQHYTGLYQADLARLGVVAPDVWCRATEHIDAMVRFAQVLEARGYCYRLPSGLYFDTSKSPGYGRLALLDLEGQKAGARVEVAEGKEHAQDFAIWRASAPGEDRQMEWASPWGRGAPGWHLECSVMSMQYLGRHFDIHTGGADHPPVHHTNEIAQSEAYLDDGQPWVAWWLHCEFINLKGAKLSKSTGGGLTLQDLVDRGYHPLAYRYLLLQSHYRSQSEFTWEALDAARSALRRLTGRFAVDAGADRLLPPADVPASDVALAYLDAFDRAVSQDLNTADALAVVHSVARDTSLLAPELAWLACHFNSVLGLDLGQLGSSALNGRPAHARASAEEIGTLVTERAQARSARDFGRADELRRHLTELGVVVNDGPDGPTWHWA